MRTDTSLDSEFHFRRLVQYIAVTIRQTLVERLEKFINQLGLSFLELIEDWPHKVTRGGKCMATAVQARFNPMFGYPYTPFSQEQSLDFGGTIIANLENDLFPEPAVIVRIEVLEIVEVSQQALVHTG